MSNPSRMTLWAPNGRLSYDTTACCPNLVLDGSTWWIFWWGAWFRRWPSCGWGWFCLLVERWVAAKHSWFLMLDCWDEKVGGSRPVFWLLLFAPSLLVDCIHRFWWGIFEHSWLRLIVLEWLLPACGLFQAIFAWKRSILGPRLFLLSKVGRSWGSFQILMPWAVLGRDKSGGGCKGVAQGVSHRARWQFYHPRSQCSCPWRLRCFGVRRRSIVARSRRLPSWIAPS